jgi:hypothetical protein
MGESASVATLFLARAAYYIIAPASSDGWTLPSADVEAI